MSFLVCSNLFFATSGVSDTSGNNALYLLISHSASFPHSKNLPTTCAAIPNFWFADIVLVAFGLYVASPHNGQEV